MLILNSLIPKYDSLKYPYSKVKRGLQFKKNDSFRNNTGI